MTEQQPICLITGEVEMTRCKTTLIATVGKHYVYEWETTPYGKCRYFVNYAHKFQVFESESKEQCIKYAKAHITAIYGFA